MFIIIQNKEKERKIHRKKNTDRFLEEYQIKEEEKNTFVCKNHRKQRE